jgi:hypothetical protein
VFSGRNFGQKIVSAFLLFLLLFPLHLRDPYDFRHSFIFRIILEFMHDHVVDL